MIIARRPQLPLSRRRYEPVPESVIAHGTALQRALVVVAIRANCPGFQPLVTPRLAARAIGTPVVRTFTQE